MMIGHNNNNNNNNNNNHRHYTNKGLFPRCYDNNNNNNNNNNEELWHDEEHDDLLVASDAFWMGHQPRRTTKATRSHHQDPLAASEQPHHLDSCCSVGAEGRPNGEKQDEQCRHDLELAKLLASEWGQSTPRPPTPQANKATFQDKLGGVLLGMTILLAVAGLIHFVIQQGTSSSSSSVSVTSVVCPYSDKDELMVAWGSFLEPQQINQTQTTKLNSLCISNEDDNDDETDPCACVNPTMPAPAATVSVSEMSMPEQSQLDQTNIVFLGEEFLGLHQILLLLDGNQTAISIGAKAERISNVLYRFDNGYIPNNLRPEIWWITLGKADLLHDRCRPDAVQAGMAQVIHRIQQHYGNNTNDSDNSTNTTNTEVLSAPKIVVALPQATTTTEEDSIRTFLEERLQCLATLLGAHVEFFVPSSSTLPANHVDSKDVDDDDNFLGDYIMTSNSRSSAVKAKSSSLSLTTTTTTTTPMTAEDMSHTILEKLKDML